MRVGCGRACDSAGETNHYCPVQVGPVALIGSFRLEMEPTLATPLTARIKEYADGTQHNRQTASFESTRKQSRLGTALVTVTLLQLLGPAVRAVVEGSLLVLLSSAKHLHHAPDRATTNIR